MLLRGAATAMMRAMTSVLFLCTGNAARSVMAGVALRERRPDLTVETAGTLSVDGMPISWRTRAALDDVGLPWPKHASRQAYRIDLAPERPGDRARTRARAVGAARARRHGRTARRP